MTLTLGQTIVLSQSPQHPNSVKHCNDHDRIHETRSEAGYRLYGEKELLRLQQILFYRELDFPLKDIARILNNPDFDLATALRQHAQQLEQERDRLNALLGTIEQTLHSLQGHAIMEPHELYQGFTRAEAHVIREQAIENYGKDAVEQSERALSSMSAASYSELIKEQNSIRDALFALQKADPASAEVQALIAKHYQNIRSFWGTANSSDPQAEQYAGLGQLYMDDPRFVTFNDAVQLDFARFMRDAMGYYAATVLKS